jgi:hypothetical protein
MDPNFITTTKDGKSRCIGRKCGEKMTIEGYPTFRYSAAQCERACEAGSNMCKLCKKQEREAEEGKSGAFHGRIGGPIPNWSHIAGSAWNLADRAKVDAKRAAAAGGGAEAKEAAAAAKKAEAAAKEVERQAKKEAAAAEAARKAEEKARKTEAKAQKEVEAAVAKAAKEAEKARKEAEAAIAKAAKEAEKAQKERMAEEKKAATQAKKAATAAARASTRKATPSPKKASPNHTRKATAGRMSIKYVPGSYRVMRSTLKGPYRGLQRNRTARMKRSSSSARRSLVPVTPRRTPTPTPPRTPTPVAAPSPKKNSTPVNLNIQNLMTEMGLGGINAL